MSIERFLSAITIGPDNFIAQMRNPATSPSSRSGGNVAVAFGRDRSIYFADSSMGDATNKTLLTKVRADGRIMWQQQINIDSYDFEAGKLVASKDGTKIYLVAEPERYSAGSYFSLLALCFNAANGALISKSNLISTSGSLAVRSAAIDAAGNLRVMAGWNGTGVPCFPQFNGDTLATIQLTRSGASSSGGNAVAMAVDGAGNSLILTRTTTVLAGAPTGMKAHLFKMNGSGNSILAEYAYANGTYALVPYDMVMTPAGAMYFVGDTAAGAGVDPFFVSLAADHSVVLARRWVGLGSYMNCAIDGAGNIYLFVQRYLNAHGKVAVLKYSPAMAYLGGYEIAMVASSGSPTYQETGKITIEHGRMAIRWAWMEISGTTEHAMTLVCGTSGSFLPVGSFTVDGVAITITSIAAEPVVGAGLSVNRYTYTAGTATTSLTEAATNVTIAPLSVPIAKLDF